MSDTDDFFTCDYFTLFGLPQTLAVEQTALADAYRRLQQSAHPDRFVGRPEAERQLAFSLASRINDAYQTLKTPLSRAAYILSLRGHNVYEETNTAMPPDFLEQQLEWREALADADEEQKRELANEIGGQRDALFAAAQTALAAGDDNAATAAVRQWVYLEKLLREIG